MSRPAGPAPPGPGQELGPGPGPGVALKAEGESAHMDTFYSAVAMVKRFQPRTAVLENVTGILMSRGKDAPSKTVQFIESDEQHGLRNIPGYTYARVEVTGKNGGLPTSRPRVWFLLVAHDAGHADSVKSNVEAFVKMFDRAPIVHAASFEIANDKLDWPAHPFVARADTDDDAASAVAARRLAVVVVVSSVVVVVVVRRRLVVVVVVVVVEVDRLAPYTKALGACFRNAVQANLLPGGWALAKADDRPSAALDPHVHMPSFLRANMDIYGEVSRHLGEYVVADISQTIGRTPPRTGGMVPTITTSSRLVAFRDGCARWFRPSELMWLHGFDPDSLNLSALSWTEAIQLVGDGMCTTSAAFVMAAVMLELGVLGRVPAEVDE